jgi:hypothetical protein
MAWRCGAVTIEPFQVRIAVETVVTAKGDLNEAAGIAVATAFGYRVALCPELDASSVLEGWCYY